MNIEMAYGVLDVLQTMQDAVKQMIEEYQAGHIFEFNSISMDLWDGLAAIQDIVTSGSEKCEEDERLAGAITCGLESLKDIKMLVLHNSGEVLWKLECELLMIIENAYLEFYCRKFVKDNPEKRKELSERIMSTGAYDRLAMPPEEREYPCDLSIFMPAYNHVDYSKLCVESILRNLPEEIKCEIVLYNHGSSDGTREYFESMPGVHVLNAAINRAFYIVGLRAMRGKYSLHVSNDIVIGKNAIRNLYRAISEHEDYGWVVPSTSAVSNLQAISVDYKNWKEFETFTDRNNIYDERRHEMRIRLCNPVTMIRTDDYNQLQRDLYEQMYCISNVSAFPDDKISLWMRRHGYKNILAKDAYCHHFGSVTHRNDWESSEQQNIFYKQGRKVFYDNFGVDPWGTGVCYDYQLFKDWRISFIDNAVILGINCGFGSNSLKIKEILREMGAKKVLLYNAFQDKRYLQDAMGLSDKAFLFKKLEDIEGKTGRKKFDFIIIEDVICGYVQSEYREAFRESGIIFGEMIFKGENGKWDIVNK